MFNPVDIEKVYSDSINKQNDKNRNKNSHELASKQIKVINKAKDIIRNNKKSIIKVNFK